MVQLHSLTQIAACTFCVGPIYMKHPQCCEPRSVYIYLVILAAALQIRGARVRVAALACASIFICYPITAIILVSKESF